MAVPQTLSAEILGPIRALFFQECEELLGELEAGLIALQRGDRDEENLNSVFRTVHSIKGSAGAFDLPALVAFAHQFENVLAAIRAGRLTVDSALIKTLLRASDVISDLVRMGRNDESVDERHGAEVSAALAKTLASLDEAEPEISDDDDFPDFEFEALPIGVDEPSQAMRLWTIQLRPHSGLYARGGELLPLFRELQRLGELSVILKDQALPPLNDLHPEKAYLAWTLTLSTMASEQDIRDICAFVESDCDIELADGLADQSAIFSRFSPAAADAASPDRAGTASTAPIAPPADTIRIDLERLDRVVNLVGELLITQGMLIQRLKDMGVDSEGHSDLPIQEMNRLTRTLQDGVMTMRAQPVKVVFQRMARLVRELETATGKQVELIVEGEGAEVDRTVIERLTDPLTHMVRNAIDHGLEAPEQRLAAGKPARGVLRLSAAHRNGRVVIEIADDGAGIDRDRVREKAVERGLIAADAALSPQEIDDLIFAPGFSTASSVTDLSGRGVGMDVVRRGVEALHGRISFTSIPGEGSTFALSLPLTLAVVDGMGARVCGHRIVVPLNGLVEAVRASAGDIRKLGPEISLLRFRGQHLPLVDLGLHFGYRDHARDPEQQVILVVEDDDGARAGLLVDEIHGQRQVVIRSLEKNYRPVEGVAAASVAGDGGIILILDVHGVLASLRREYSTEFQS